MKKRDIQLRKIFILFTKLTYIWVSRIRKKILLEILLSTLNLLFRIICKKNRCSYLPHWPDVGKIHCEL